MRGAYPIVRTKLYRPPLPPDFVRRARLQDGVRDTVLSYPLTLVSAAAGYGKSTLVSSWLEELDCSSAWLSLDESHNNLREFVRYLVGAVRGVAPSGLAQTAALLGPVKLPPLPVLAGTLINELDELDEPLVLVLDDIHRIHDQAVLDLLTEVSSYPPNGLHLVLVGRRDPSMPLARLRALDRMTEIRSGDLRLNAAETASFLEAVLGTTVDAGTADAWTQQTEGWVTGLRLATLGLRGSGRLPDRPFSGGRSWHHAMQYLLQEVLERQPPAILAYLLGSSIAERFSAPLCDALREAAAGEHGNGTDGHAFLDWLEENALFVIPLDAERTWFRYHHLFRSLLCEETERQWGRGRLAALHRRASEWFEGEGLVDEALDQALAAQDTERAADILERNGRGVELEAYPFLWERRLAQLPEALVQERPDLLLVRAYLHYRHMDLAAIPPNLDRVDALVGGDAEAHALSGDVAVLRGICAYFAGEGPRALAYAKHALERIPPADVRFRSMAETYFGLASQMAGQMGRGRHAMSGWLANTSPLGPSREWFLLFTLTLTHYMEGELTEAERHLPRQREVARPNGLENALGWHDYLAGLFHLQRGELDAAIRSLEAAAGKRYVHFTRAAADGLCALALAYQLRGRPADATATLHSLTEFVRNLAPHLEILADSCAARLALLEGRPDAAVRQPQVDIPLRIGVTAIWWEIPHVTRCRALIAEGTAESLAEAQARLAAYMRTNQAQHNTLQLIGLSALQAAAFERQEKRKEARAALDRALSLARPGGVVFPFIEPGPPMAALLRRRRAEEGGDADFIQRILSAGRAQRQTSNSDRRAAVPNGTSRCGLLPESLTPREIKVLELLGRGLYQKEIAERLFISPETVKTHLKHIYQKLGVQDRRSAVDRARDIASGDQTPV